MFIENFFSVSDTYYYLRGVKTKIQSSDINQLWASLRKSKDYVYGIWVYKALDIWKGYYRVKKSLVSYVICVLKS